MNELSADYIKAQDLDRKIKVSAQLAQQSLYDMCMGIKEMRDSRLYKELGFSEFNDYCKSELEFTDRQAYNFISIAENLSSELVKSISLIGTTKLTLLAKLDEPEREKIVQNTNLESTTVKELKEKIADLKTANERLMTKVDEAEDKAKKSSASESKAWGKVSVLQTDSDLQKQKISQLETQVKDLENRPVEVAVMDDSKEVADLKDAMKRVDREWAEKYSELEEQGFKERREFYQEKQAEIDRLTADYEKKLAEKPSAEPVSDDKAVFKAYLSAAADSVTRLVSFVNEHNNSDNYGLFTQKARQLADIINSKLEV